MRSGNLRHQITLQQKGSVVRDALGGETITWSDVVTVWAEADPKQLRERLELKRQQGVAALGFRVRTPFAAALDKRIVYDSAYYNITEIDATRKHRGELLIIAVAEDTAP